MNSNRVACTTQNYLQEQVKSYTFLPYMVSANVGPWIWNGTPVPGPEMGDNMTSSGNHIRPIGTRILYYASIILSTIGTL